MGTCCTTRDKSISGDLATRKHDTAGGLNEIQKSLPHLTSYLDLSKIYLDSYDL